MALTTETKGMTEVIEAKGGEDEAEEGAGAVEAAVGTAAAATTGTRARSRSWMRTGNRRSHQSLTCRRNLPMMSRKSLAAPSVRGSTSTSLTVLLSK